MTGTTDAVPTAIRRLGGDDAARLAGLVGAYDDLQTMLRCCERLLTVLDAGGGHADDLIDELGVESLWTLALLCYGRAFGDGGAGPLREDDLVQGDGGAGADDETVRRHRVLMHLRDHHADTVSNPRETYTVGIAQDADGAVNAVAVTSVHAPQVDREAVRQAGAMVLPLCSLLDERIGELQKTILARVRDTPKRDLDAMDLIEVAAAG